MKLNQNIILCLAKLAKSSVIKEISLMNQRKTYAKGIFVNKSLLFVHIQPTEVICILILGTFQVTSKQHVLGINAIA